MKLTLVFIAFFAIIVSWRISTVNSFCEIIRFCFSFQHRPSLWLNQNQNQKQIPKFTMVILWKTKTSPNSLTKLKRLKIVWQVVDVLALVAVNKVVHLSVHAYQAAAAAAVADKSQLQHQTQFRCHFQSPSNCQSQSNCHSHQTEAHHADHHHANQVDQAHGKNQRNPKNARNASNKRNPRNPRNPRNARNAKAARNHHAGAKNLHIDHCKNIGIPSFWSSSNIFKECIQILEA